MTEKKENILEVALNLFAKDGYEGTSTSKIAKDAGVSEGLIFKHFKNKEGLLKALIEEGEKIIFKTVEPLLDKHNSKDVIYGFIKLPFELEEENYNYWILMYSIKWNNNINSKSHYRIVHEALSRAFEDLSFRNPTAEADIIILLIDGLITTILLHQPENADEIRRALLNKYNL